MTSFITYQIKFIMKRQLTRFIKSVFTVGKVEKYFMVGKVEQFVISRKVENWSWLEKMVKFVMAGL